MRRLAYPAYLLAVLGIACAATWTADHIPTPNPITAWAVDAFAGCVAGLTALNRIPCPCTCHRKDRSR